MCDPVSASLVLGGIGMYKQAEAGKAAADAQSAATTQATAAAKAQADAADQANNRANGKQPDIAGLASATAQAGKGGISGTMLTGPQGVDPKTLLLGRTTLLGG